MAAEQGHGGAQYNLGLLYERGRGVRLDLVHAHMWYDIATAMLSGDAGLAAKKRRDQIAKQMTAAQIEKAQEIASIARSRSTSSTADIGRALYAWSPSW